MRYVVLSLDPATTYGYAIFEVRDGGHICIHRIGIVKVNHRADNLNEGEMCIDVLNSVCTLVEDASRIAAGETLTAFVEDYYFGRRTCNGANVNLYIRAATYMALAQHGVHYRRIHPSAWKSWACIGPKRGGATKDEVKRSLERRFNFAFPDHTMHGNTKLKFKYDMSDAVGIGFFGVSAMPTWTVTYASSSECLRHRDVP